MKRIIGQSSQDRNLTGFRVCRFAFKLRNCTPKDDGLLLALRPWAPESFKKFQRKSSREV